MITWGDVHVYSYLHIGQTPSDSKMHGFYNSTQGFDYCGPSLMPIRVTLEISSAKYSITCEGLFPQEKTVIIAENYPVFPPFSPIRLNTEANSRVIYE